MRLVAELVDLSHIRGSRFRAVIVSCHLVHQICKVAVERIVSQPHLPIRRTISPHGVSLNKWRGFPLTLRQNVRQTPMPTQVVASKSSDAQEARHPMVGVPDTPPANGSRLETRSLLCGGFRANANWEPLPWSRFFGAGTVAFSIGSKPGGGFLYHQWTLGESALRTTLVSPSGFLVAAGTAAIGCAASLATVRSYEAERNVAQLVKLHDDLDTPDNVQSAAEYALRRLGEPAVDALLRDLETGDDTTAGLAAHVLGQMGNPRATAPLLCD
jgi:hypothetical protein